MKKFMIMAVMLVGIGMAAFAQSGKWGVGLNLGYGTDLSKPSVGVKALYDVTEKFTVAPSFNYYFQQKESYEGVEVKLNYWDVNCDLHWNLVSKETYRLYPLVGLTYLHAKACTSVSSSGYDVDVAASEGKFGANIGFGSQFRLTDQLVAAAELKYQFISGAGQLVPSVSLMYKF